MRQRKMIVEEILQTEQSYLKTLQDIQRLFVVPLADIITKRQLQDIFSNINDILQVNTELYDQLNKKLPLPEDGGCVGDVFLYLSPFLKIYSVFVKNYQNAMQVVMELQQKNSRFAQHLTLQASECRGLSFQGFILAPVQRIPRYKLLLEDLLKHTPEHHSDFSSLTKALSSIEQVATFVNEMIREHESVMKMLALQKVMTGLPEDLIVPGRRFLKQGVVTKICRKSNKTRALFLFSDVLIYASLSSRKSESQLGVTQSQYINVQSSQFIFHKMLRLEGMTVLDVPDTDFVKNCFQILTADKSFAVYCSSQQEKTGWITAVDKAVCMFLINKSTLKVEEVEVAQDLQEEENLAPIWVPDNVVIACMQCDARFSITKRRHHCRSCGRVLCSSCSGKKSVLPKFNNAETSKRSSMATFNSSHVVPSVKPVQQVRVCGPCYELIEGKMFHLTDKFSDKRSVREMQRPSMAHDLSPSIDALVLDESSQVRPIPGRRKPLGNTASLPTSTVLLENSYSSSVMSDADLPLAIPRKRATPSILGSTRLMRENSLRIRSRSVTSLTILTDPMTVRLSRRQSFQAESKVTFVEQLKRRSKAFFSTPSKDRLYKELSEKIKPRYIAVHTPDGTENQVFFQPESHPIQKAGFLSKCGKTWKTWKARWMVLTDQELSWFVPEESVVKELTEGTVRSRLDIIGNKHWMNSMQLDECTQVSYADMEEFCAPLKFKRAPKKSQGDFVCEDQDDMYPFKLVTDDRTLFMIADTKKQRDEWIDALTAAIGNCRNLTECPDDLVPPPIPSSAPSRSPSLISQ